MPQSAMVSPVAHRPSFVIFILDKPTTNNAEPVWQYVILRIDLVAPNSTSRVRQRGISERRISGTFNQAAAASASMPVRQNRQDCGQNHDECHYARRAELNRSTKQDWS
jgi:hypothetical protein